MEAIFLGTASAIARNLRVCWLIALFFLAFAYEPRAATLIAGSSTNGGLVEGAQILKVTSLDDDGPGSLRNALAAAGPRVVVFEVGGLIRLTSDLAIRNPSVTVAGKTAPVPGITITGGSLRIRTHDVVIEHIAVRPGPGNSSEVNDNRDGISIDGVGKRNDGKDASYNIMLKNLSVSWSVDEAISLWYPTTHSVTIKDSIIAESLSNAGHPKGEHSMGLLIGGDIQRVQVTGNLFISNKFRNPAVSQGASAYIANNYIVNAGHNGIHFYNRETSARTTVAIVSNFFEKGPDTRRQIAPISFHAAPASELMDVFMFGNLSPGVTEASGELWQRSDPASTAPSINASSFNVLPAREVPAYVMANAGSRPNTRNLTDARLIDEIQRHRARIVNFPRNEELSSVSLRATRRRLLMPEELSGVLSGNSIKTVSEWLALFE